MVPTATKFRKDQSGVVSNTPGMPKTSNNSELYGIIISMFLQDAPFLVLRLLLIFDYGVVSYTNMFFTCKNTLVCMLLTYRLVVIQLERCQCREWNKVAEPKHKKFRLDPAQRDATPDEYYGYATEVVLKESARDFDEPVTYAIRRHISEPDDVNDDETSGLSKVTVDHEPSSIGSKVVSGESSPNLNRTSSVDCTKEDSSSISIKANQLEKKENKSYAT